MTGKNAEPWLTIIGIGEDGMAGLSAAARKAIEQATVIIGGDRHHQLAPNVTAERLSWPHPFSALIDELKARRAQRPVVIATGDPLWFSVGARIARAIPPAEIVFHPQLSAFQWAACRMGWSLADTETLTAHGRPAEQIVPWFWPGARLLVLTAGAETPGQIARLLRARGYGMSLMTVMGNLGGPQETRHEGIAEDWAAHDPADTLPAFHTLAIECRGHPSVPLPRVPGLPDDAFEHDGKLTKREVRAATLARLMPSRGAVLWDIGVGCGSVAVEWSRAARDAVAVGIDPNAARLAMAGRNAMALGAPRLHLIEGRAPAALNEIPAPKGTSADLRNPDAVFIGGGLSEEVFTACWDRLPRGGRLVANAVTLESEAVLISLHARHGGELTRIAVQRAEAVGTRTGWRPSMPVTQWALIK
jgi:precorrin-6Y C5,15-methyltransferase (decarboxylating)